MGSSCVGVGESSIGGERVKCKGLCCVGKGAMLVKDCMGELRKTTKNQRKIHWSYDNKYSGEISHAYGGERGANEQDSLKVKIKSVSAVHFGSKQMIFSLMWIFTDYCYGWHCSSLAINRLGAETLSSLSLQVSPSSWPYCAKWFLLINWDNSCTFGVCENS